MDDAVDEELTPLDTAEGGHLQSKESECFLKPESYNILESQGMFIAGGGNDYTQSSFKEFSEMLDGKNANGGGGCMYAAEGQYKSLQSTGDAGVTVEELALENYSSSNLHMVGTSTNLGRRHWQHIHQLPNGSGSGSSRGGAAYRDRAHIKSSGLEDVNYASSLGIMAEKPYRDDHDDKVEELTNSENRVALGDNHSSIRTKILSKSGFTEFFVKSTLKGKGVICKRPLHDCFHLDTRDKNSTKVAGRAMEASDALQTMDAKTVIPPRGVYLGSRNSSSNCNGVNLREWLNVGRSKVNKLERLYIFKQILDLVDYSHSQGAALHGLRPTNFKLLPSNQVKFVGETLHDIMSQDVSPSGKIMVRKRAVERGMIPPVGLYSKRPKVTHNTRSFRQWSQFPGNLGLGLEIGNGSHVNINSQHKTSNKIDEGDLNIERRSESTSCSLPVSYAREHMVSVAEQLEEKWYASPEELSEGSCNVSSNIYALGVLLFELLAHFQSDNVHAPAMSDLRHRILPPNFLSENPKEAGFCLWLLHPDSSSRPTTREILQSEVINGLQEVCTEQLSSVDEDDNESELLSHFLLSLKEQKQKDASKLVEDIRCLEADIQEVERRYPLNEPFPHSPLNKESSLHGRQNLFFCKEPSTSQTCSQCLPLAGVNGSRLMENIDQLEAAYFCMRPKVQLPETDATARLDKELLKNGKNWYMAQKDEEKQIATDRVGAFFDGLCKYARYSKYEVRGVQRNGEFSSSSNVICSLSFDRDEDYFAAASVSKKIKIFEFNALLNNSVDIHYPVVEMSNKSMLSCVCWNNYIKNYLASTDYDGAVKIWDASTGQAFTEYNEHEKRAWSVDFSQVYPTKLASGSDDCTVKLWGINEKSCLGTVRSIANVCCVQFSAHSTHLLAFGSADYKTYCYDLRYAKTPWCVLAGHNRAVSFVKFLDSETLVSASTDNTLKLWDLKRSTPSGPSTSACCLTLSGHTNEKNFVGLSVSDGYIACGSETNEVYAYYRSLPMPITSHKFGSIDSISGKEIDDDNGQFVSSVCWKGTSDMVVAANSSGCIKVLQIV